MILTGVLVLMQLRKSAADDYLCSNILRDSLDPVALAVMISGSKLPPPRTANELLGATFGSSSSSSVSDAAIVEGRWSGPVLIAQGMKDPLNDAVGRANMFQALREDIEIAPLDGGHCPHVSSKGIIVEGRAPEQVLPVLFACCISILSAFHLKLRSSY